MNFTSVSGKNWIFKKFVDTDVQKYAESYSLSATVAKLLAIRKKNITDVNLYLNPTIKNVMPNPFSLKDMDFAVERSYQAIINNESLGIFGDYDVDGATSTALLSRFFLSIKQNIHTYIPDRKKEGYGPSIEGFNKLIKSNTKVIFTVDCGTLSYEPIKFAQEKKIDIVVLDHHQSEIQLPNACALVNPNRHDDTSNLNYLCAAGVCFMFLVALNMKLREKNWFKINKIIEPDILNLLDLVSLGTVCDVVPLVGLNRAIVKQGLKIMKRRKNLGLKTLYDLCKIESQPTTFDLGFLLGPRINAGGRVGKSSHGAELLTSEDPSKAYKLAVDLDKFNTERKSIELLLIEEVNKQAEIFKKDSVLVLCGNNWHEGIIGIVASRIKDKYNKAVIIISLGDEFGKGSARSIFGFDIGANIIQGVQKGLLKKGGGHKMAGGFVIEKQNIDLFRKFLIKKFEKTKIKNSDNPDLFLDTVIAPSALNEDFYKEISSLGPFGPGNNEPKFVIENIKIISSKNINENLIKSVLCGKDGSVFKSIVWNAQNTPLEAFLNKSNKKLFNIAGKMKLNEWRGKRNIEFVIEDISIPS
jgi:single-stranded-DNA-specific exonuclease